MAKSQKSTCRSTESVSHPTNFDYTHESLIDVKAGQNRGKAALEFADSPSAHKAASHMDGGQLDGSILKVELSELPIRSSSRSRPLPPPRNGRDGRRSSS